MTICMQRSILICRRKVLTLSGSTGLKADVTSDSPELDISVHKVIFHSIMLAAGAGAAVLAAGTTLAATAQAGSSAGTAVTLAGSIGALPAGSGTMLVEAHISEGINSEDVPSQFLDITLASAQVSRGPFSIQVPKSRDLMRAERLGNGWVNFSIVIDSGDYVTSQYIPVPMASRAANGSQPAAQEVLGHAVTVPHFRSFRVMNSSMRRILTSEGGRPDGVVPCEWLKYGSQREDETRIGEVHTDTDSGSTDEFKYATQADSTITVGVSASASSGWSGDGSVKISNHFGGSGSFPNPAGTLKYARSASHASGRSSGRATQAVPPPSVKLWRRSGR